METQKVDEQQPSGSSVMARRSSTFKRLVQEVARGINGSKQDNGVRVSVRIHVPPQLAIALAVLVVLVIGWWLRE